MKHHHLYAGLIAELSSAVHSSSCVIAELTTELEEYRQQPYDVGPASLAYEDFNDVETRQAGQEAMYIAGKESRNAEIAVLHSQIAALQDRLSNAEGPDANAVEPYEPFLKSVKGAKLKAYKREIAELKEENLQLTEETAELRERNNTLLDQLKPDVSETEDPDAELADLHTQIKNFKRLRYNVQNKCEAFEQEIAELKERDGEWRTESFLKTQEIADLKQEIAELKESGGHAVQEANYQRGEAERLQARINEICKAAHTLLDVLSEVCVDTYLLRPGSNLKIASDALIDALNGT